MIWIHVVLTIKTVTYGQLYFLFITHTILACSLSYVSSTRSCNLNLFGCFTMVIKKAFEIYNCSGQINTAHKTLRPYNFAICLYPPMLTNKDCNTCLLWRPREDGHYMAKKTPYLQCYRPYCVPASRCVFGGQDMEVKKVRVMDSWHLFVYGKGANNELICRSFWRPGARDGVIMITWFPFGQQ